MNRRELLGGMAVGGAALPLARLSAASALAPPRTAAGADAWRGLKAGVASYSLRKLPLDAAIAATRRVGLRYVSINVRGILRATA